MTRIALVLCTLSLTFLYCCKEVGGSEDPAPEVPSLTLEVNGASGQTSLNAAVGDTVYLRVTTRTDLSMAHYSAVYEVLGESVTLETLTPDSSVVEFTTDYEFLIDFTLSGKEVAFTFSVSDTTGLSDEATLTVTVAESPIKSAENVIVSPYNYLEYGNIYDVENDTVYFPSNLKSVAANQSGTDFIFAFDAEVKWMVMSPDEGNASTLWVEETGAIWPLQNPNATRFKMLNNADVDFDAIVTSAQLDDFFTDGETLLSGLAVGQVIAFRLDDSKGEKTGLIRITQITGNTSSPRQLTFDLKVQD